MIELDKTSASETRWFQIQILTDMFRNKIIYFIVFKIAVSNIIFEIGKKFKFTYTEWDNNFVHFEYHRYF